MRIIALALALVACSSSAPLPEPPRNYAIDFVTFAVPETTCRALDKHTAVCRLPDKALVYCTAGAGKPTCEAIGAEKAKAP